MKTKSMNQIKETCGGLAEVEKVRGQSIAKIVFYKNWGHGKLGGDQTEGVLGQLSAAGFAVERGHYGNTYTINFA